MTKKLLFFLFLFVFITNSILNAQKNKIAVITLKTGYSVKGEIIEQSDQILKIKTIDGSVMIYSFDDITKIGKEEYKITNKALPERVNYEKTTLFLGGIALHPSQTSGFIMLGKVQNFGGYLKLQSNLNFNGSFVSEGNSWSTNRYFKDNIYTGRYAISGGVLWRVIKPIILYGGLGYGNRWVNWETISGEQFRVNDISYQGLELETGVIFKLNKLFFTGGVSLIPFQYMELNIGAGFTL